MPDNVNIDDYSHERVKIKLPGWAHSLFVKFGSIEHSENFASVQVELEDYFGEEISRLTIERWFDDTYAKIPYSWFAHMEIIEPKEFSDELIKFFLREVNVINGAEVFQLRFKKSSDRLSMLYYLMGREEQGERDVLI